MDHRHWVAALVAPLCLLAAGCDDNVPPPAVPQSPPGALGEPQDQDDGKNAQVEVAKDIADLCNLPTPRFDFDSANVGSPAKSTLDALADCLMTGPLKDANLNLVGHADPRGETGYNFGLGQRRAGHVAEYLTAAGVADKRLSTSSRGELEAKGTDEAGWSKDRRVEIVLAK